MVEPTLAPEASAAIEEYVIGIARRSELAYALAEDARRELAAHVTELAKERARARNALTADASDARKAIEAMGADSGVLAAFFQSSVPPAQQRAAYGRAFLLTLSIVAGLASMFSLVIIVGGLEFQEVFAIIPTFAAAIFGSAAIWMFSARWSILSAAFVFSLPVIVFGATGNDDWLIWIFPAIALALGGIVRGQMPAGARPTSRISIDLEPVWDRAVRNWRRVGHATFATLTVLLAAMAFTGFVDVDLWAPGLLLLALAFGGVFCVGRVSSWIPFVMACAIFVGTLVAYEMFPGESMLLGIAPAIALALDSLFVAAFPSTSRKASSPPPVPA